MTMRVLLSGPSIFPTAQCRKGEKKGICPWETERGSPKPCSPTKLHSGGWERHTPTVEVHLTDRKGVATGGVAADTGQAGVVSSICAGPDAKTTAS
jgi:hypothetical protein